MESTSLNIQPSEVEKFHKLVVEYGLERAINEFNKLKPTATTGDTGPTGTTGDTGPTGTTGGTS